MLWKFLFHSWRSSSSHFLQVTLKKTRGLVFILARRIGREHKNGWDVHSMMDGREHFWLKNQVSFAIILKPRKPQLLQVFPGIINSPGMPSSPPFLWPFPATCFSLFKKGLLRMQPVQGAKLPDKMAGAEGNGQTDSRALAPLLLV